MPFKDPEKRKQYQIAYTKRTKQKRIDKWKSIKSDNDKLTESRLQNKEACKRYRENHPDRRKTSCKKWNDNNKDGRKKYYEVNKRTINRWNNEYTKQRRKNDPEFKFIGNARKRVWDALRNNNKSATTKELLGAPVEEVRTHIESQFTEGMTWDNYGQWHVDHIRPCASFDLTDPKQQKECFNYKNLQPLWAIDNMKKGAKTCNSK